MHNSAKIMSTSGTTAIRFIVRNTAAARLIPIITSNIVSKSPVIRRQCCEFIELLLQTWPTSVLDRQSSALYEAVKKGISDADADARFHSRRAFWAFDEHFKEQANQLFSTLDSGQQTQLTSVKQSHHQQQQQMCPPSRLRSMSTDRGSLSSHSRLLLTAGSLRVQSAASKPARVSRGPAAGSRSGSPSRSQSVSSASRLHARVPQSTSRNASPSRLYGRDKRSVGAGQPAGCVSVPKSADDMQSALTTALMMRGRSPAADAEDVASGSSSLCSDSSYHSDGILLDPAIDDLRMSTLLSLVAHTMMITMVFNLSALSDVYLSD